MTTNGSPVFRVDLVGNVAEETKLLAEDAERRGIRTSFVEALASIYERLRRTPLTFGEYCYELPGLGLWSYVGAIQPVAVRYFMRHQPPIVLVTKIILMGS
jgi:hypothetical protein